MFLPSRDLALTIPGRESRGSGPVRPRAAVSKTADGGSNPPYRAMFNKDKTTLTIESIEIPGRLSVVQLSLTGPSTSVLTAFMEILKGADSVTINGTETAVEELPPSAALVPPSPPVRLLDPPYDGEPRTP